MEIENKGINTDLVHFEIKRSNLMLFDSGILNIIYI